MINKIAVICAEYFLKKGVIAEEDKDTYIYGFDVTLYTIVSTVGLLIIGLISDRLLSTSIVISIFYTSQSNGGGYHAKTHLKCFCVMCIGLICGLVFETAFSYEFVYWVIGVISINILLLHPLVLHENKAYLRTKKRQLRIRSRIITTLCLVGSIVSVIEFSIPVRIFSVSFLLAAVSRLVGYISEQLRRREEHGAK